MKNLKLWRTALVATLVLTVMLSVTGGTIAWFTDSVTSESNIIKSGTLDVTMEWKDATSTGKQQAYKDASEGAIFNYDLWEPGYVEAKNVRISNVGTLALQYALNVVANGEVSILADVIDVYFAEGEMALTSRDMSGLTKVGTLSEILAGMPAKTEGDLLKDETDAVTIALKMQETAGNDYQGKAVGTNFSVKLEATQLTHEQDSFGPDYDANAVYGEYGATHERVEMNVPVDEATQKFDMAQDVAVFMAPGNYDNSMLSINGAGDSDSDFALVGDETVFTGNLEINSHSNITLSDDAVLTIDGITVEGTLEVTSWYKNIIVKNVKAKGIAISNSGSVTIENCVLDGAADNGLFVTPYVQDYNVTIRNNIIKNSAKNAIQIAGNASGTAYSAGVVTVTDNTFENWCTLNDKLRAAFKVWGDAKITPSDLTNNTNPTLTQDARDLINAVEAGNNTFTTSEDNTNQVKYDLWGYTFNSLPVTE